MDVSVNWFAVLLAAASTMVVGSLWYSPLLYYKQWAKMAGVKEDKNMTSSKMAVLYGLVFVASLVSAYILAHVAFLSNHFFQNSFLQDTLTTGFWLWLGFTAARLYTHDAFEGRRKKLTAINLGNEFVTIMVMALIIGLMGN